MDDQFLHEHRRAPRPAFARALREQLRGADEAPMPRTHVLHRLAYAVGAVALVAGLFTVPAVRVVAQQALAVFRVGQFTPVEFDPARMDRLREVTQTADPAGTLVGDPEVVREPAPPQPVATLAEAASRAGLERVLEPAELPKGMERRSIEVSGPGELRYTVHTAKLREILDALDARDLRVPEGLDGQPITLAVPAAVIQEFKSERREARLVQAVSPEVTLPAGVELAQLGEIGLRMLGMTAQEAKRIAQSVDWRTTLLVPVPMGAASFQNMTIRTHTALLVRGEATLADGTKRTRHMLVWAEGDRVFALQGDTRPEDLVAMAESLR